QRIHLGVFPRSLGFPAPELAGLAHRARLAAATHLATFLILGALLEAALGHVLVDLGTTHLVARAHDIDRRLLAAFQRSQDLVDHTVVNQRLQAVWGDHAWKIR